MRKDLPPARMEGLDDNAKYIARCSSEKEPGEATTGLECAQWMEDPIRTVSRASERGLVFSASFPDSTAVAMSTPVMFRGGKTPSGRSFA